MELRGFYIVAATKAKVQIKVCSKCSSTLRLKAGFNVSWWIRTCPVSDPTDPKADETAPGAKERTPWKDPPNAKPEI